ncbi:MAG: aspartate aminotransferase family protein, partial [Acidiferrobacterales bacterium]
MEISGALRSRKNSRTKLVKISRWVCGTMRLVARVGATRTIRAGRLQVDKSFRFSDRHHDLTQRDARHVLGWRYQPRVIFESGSGITLTDVDGKEYYDLTSGMMCMVLGHSHPELTETIRQQATSLVHHSSWYANPLIIEFAELLGTTLPGNLTVVNFTVTGSEANEVAMRMALGVSGKYDIVSVIRGLHGGSLAAESVTTVGGARRRNLGPLMIPSRTNTILAPFCYRCPINLSYPHCGIACLDSSEQMMEAVTSQDVAAVMAETILVAGGMIVPPPEWLPRLKQLAVRWDALLVLDEAQLAPARTGKLWGFEHYDVVPDIVSFAKGMSAGMAICGTVTTPEIAEKATGKAGVPWAGTYSGDPLAAAVALKQLQIVLRDNLVERAAILGEVLREQLESLCERFDIVGDVRGQGLYRMLDIVTDEQSKTPDPEMAERIRYNMMMEGLVCICVKNFIRICPPLIVTAAQIEETSGRIETAIERSQAGYPKDIDFTAS